MMNNIIDSQQQHNNNVMERSDSFASFEGFSLDEDCYSLSSMKSVDVVLKMLGETSSSDPVVGQEIDINDHDDNDLDMLLEPFQDLDNDNVLDSFSPEQELRHRQISPNTSLDSWSHHDSDNGEISQHEQQQQVSAFSQEEKEEESVYDDNHISSLMTGDLIELEDTLADDCKQQQPKPRAVPNTAAKTSIRQRQIQQPQQVCLPGPIVQILAYLYHHEPNRQVLLQAEEIVRDSVVRHQTGKQRKYSQKNLTGTILERFVHMLGGPRFQEIYQAAVQESVMDTSVYLEEQQRRVVAAWQQQRHHRSISSSVVPSYNTLQLAIAYGMHLAKLTPLAGHDNDDDDNDGHNGQHDYALVERVHSGVASLNAMNEKECQMFWNYATVNQG